VCVCVCVCVSLSRALFYISRIASFFYPVVIMILTSSDNRL